MRKNNIFAFTLVELIVVITILAILWTIAFISLQWYSRDARDSTRTSDLWNIKTSLELYTLQTWKYPSPDSFSTITYSWWTEDVWYQWVVWDIVTTNLKSLNDKPLDPLTNDPYVYSTTNSYKEYEVLALYEWSVAYNTVINTANAATTQLIPKIAWNYNWVFVKTTNYIIPTPSIVIADPLLTWTPISLPLTPLNIKSLVMTNGTNIPKNSLTPSQTWWLDIKLSVYTWSITKTSSTWAMISALQQIQWAYTWTTISSQSNIAYILNQTTNDQLIALWNITILKWSKPLTSNTNATPTSSKKTVSNCTTWTWVLYWTLDWTDVWLTCSDDIIVCNWTAWSWITISACNAWSTAVVLSDSSNKIISYWWLYQWWNNHNSRWWQFTDWNVYTTTTTAQVTTAQNYTTYSSNAFILWNHDWTTQDSNGILRSSNWNLCQVWYHIPTQPEWNNIFTYLWVSQTSFSITNQLKLPLAGTRYRNNATLFNQSTGGFYWSSSINGTNGYYIIFNSTAIDPVVIGFRAEGYSVRCFKN